MTDSRTLKELSAQLILIAKEIEDLVRQIEKKQANYSEISNLLVIKAGESENPASAYTHDGHLFTIDWASEELDWSNGVNIQPINEI